MAELGGKYQQYAEYKDSGVEWLDVIPSHWNTVSLKMLIDVRDGTHETPSYVEKTDNSYPLVTSKDVTSGQIDLTDCKHISQQDYESIIKRSAVSEGDILMPMIGTVGSPVLVEDRLEIAIKNLALFRTSENNDKITAKFLHYFLNSKECSMQFSLEGRGGVQNFVSLGTLRSLGLPLISLEDQVQIADFLDYETAQIDTLIEKKQTLIKLLKEKRQAVISHAVTKGLNPDTPMKDSGVEWLGEVPEHWEVWKFQHIAPIITCGIASTPTYVDEDEGMPFLSAQNIRDNKLSLHKYNYIPYQLHEQLTKYRKPKMGDLLVTRVGAGIGDACVIDIEMEFSIYVSLTHIRVDPLIGLNKFVMYFFGSDYCKYLNYQGTVTGGGVGNLNVGNVERYKIPLPDLGEQANIVHYLETESAKFDNLIKKAEQAIQIMQERRTALISAAVTGKIDVRGWQVPD